jgi:hypothetical protein
MEGIEVTNDELNKWIHANVLQTCWHEWKWPQGWDYTKRICSKCSEQIDPHFLVGKEKIPVFNWQIPDNPDYCSSLDAAAKAEAKAIEEKGSVEYGNTVAVVLRNPFTPDERRALSDDEVIALFLTASARQRCEAIYQLYTNEGD